MSRVAWFNCHAGVAGDMLLASLVDAGADPVAVMNVVGGLAIDGFALSFESTQRAGVVSTRAIVAVDDHSEHDHRAWSDVRALLERSDLPERVLRRSLETFECLAAVEAKIHGVDVEAVEFHEVGALDSIVDVVGVAAALEVLSIDRIECSAIATGHGTIDTRHGRLPNPSPAVVGLSALRQVPVIGVDDHRELSTPTGVALMVALADSFGPMPAMNVESRGHGAGTRDVPGRANVTQVVVGVAADASHSRGGGQLVRLLEANVDDVTGEVIAHTIGRLLAEGAHDAWATPIVMKKGRPAFTVHVLCDPSRTDAMSALLVAETGTLGVRGSLIERWPQRRSETVVLVDGHEIRVKVAGDRVKVEYDDAARVAHELGVPLREILLRAESAVR